MKKSREGGTGRQGGREMETGRGVGRVSSSYCRFSMLYPYAYDLCMVDTVSIHRLHKHTPNTHYHHTATCRGKVAHVCLCFCLSVSVFVSFSLSVRTVSWERAPVQDSGHLHCCLSADRRRCGVRGLNVIMHKRRVSTSLLLT